MVEENDMWKQHEMERKRKVFSGQSFLDDNRWDMRGMPRRRQTAHMDEEPQNSTFWMRQLWKAEERDPGRWGHNGYRELYPTEFNSDRSDEEDDNRRRTDKSKKYKKKNKHHRHKRDRSSETKKKKKKKRSSRDRSADKDNERYNGSSNHTRELEKADRKDRHRRKRKVSNESESHSSESEEGEIRRSKEVSHLRNDSQSDELSDRRRKHHQKKSKKKKRDSVSPYSDKRHTPVKRNYRHKNNSMHCDSDS